MKMVENNLPKLPNGNIDVCSYNAFEDFSNAFIFDIDDIKRRYGNNVLNVIKRMTFDPNKFNENELRFHQITREPFINLANDLLLVSPELLLDSLFTNIHYSLLEGCKEVREEYKKRSSDRFVDSIVKVANKIGYIEMSRELDLYEGKRSIGDVDLILKNDNDEYILVEAKNHALPLNVYFKGIEFTQQHLCYLKNEWEKKVLIRYEHIRQNYKKYNIGDKYRYIIISIFPEIISHYSDLTILSLFEFEDCINNGFDEFDFNKIYYRIY
jgi:hypothetical protein